MSSMTTISKVSDTNTELNQFMRDHCHRIEEQGGSFSITSKCESTGYGYNSGNMWFTEYMICWPEKTEETIAVSKPEDFYP